MDMNKAFMLRKEDRAPQWHVIDASGKVLGRLATQIADVLRGKDRPEYTPHGDAGDYVVVINAEKVALTGKKWDGKGIAYSVDVWKRVFDRLKPGGHLLAFGGTRTYHRLTCAIEDAGFEIRDSIDWITGQGFPKSVKISKMLDAREQTRWLDVGKALDKIDKKYYIEAWVGYSKNVKSAGLKFLKSETGIGMNMTRSDSVPAPVVLQVNLERSNASAIIDSSPTSFGLPRFLPPNGSMRLKSVARRSF